jgi:serine protease inhibitor ecotin
VGTGKTAKQCRKKASGAECTSTTEPHLRARLAAWTDAESLKLTEAVALYGRDWVSVSRAVVTKTPLQCSDKMRDEVSAGRLEDPPKKQVHVLWTPEEQQKLHAAVALHGRDWVAVSKEVNSGKTRVQCMTKGLAEIAAGRIPEPGAKVSHLSWTETEISRLKDAVGRHKRNFVAIANEVATKTRQQCKDKVKVEIQAGRLRVADDIPPLGTQE